jgi:hypothetical protein
MKLYQELALEIIRLEEEIVRTSTSYSVGDDYEEDIFD